MAQEATGMSAREWGRLASSAVEVLRAMLSDVMGAVQQTATVSLAATLRCEAPHVQARQLCALGAVLSSSSSSSSVLELSAYALAHATHLPLSLRSAIEQAGGGGLLDAAPQNAARQAMRHVRALILQSSAIKELYAYAREEDMEWSADDDQDTLLSNATPDVFYIS